VTLPASAFSPAQLLGYLACALGVAAFLQRVDRRLKLLLAGESVAYFFHFLLLGNPAAAVTGLANAGRFLLSARLHGRWIALLAVAVYLSLGLAFAGHGAGWLPVVSGVLGSVAVFTLRGVRMRLLLLASTSLWIVNNVLSGSIGGTLLESFIAVASLYTLVQMLRASRPAPAAPPAEP
jgi:hypothetical protein